MRGGFDASLQSVTVCMRESHVTWSKHIYRCGMHDGDHKSIFWAENLQHYVALMRGNIVAGVGLSFANWMAVISPLHSC